MKPLVLYGDILWISPYFFTVLVALEEKKLPYEVRALALQDKATKDPAYQVQTVTGRVPALTHGAFTVAESSAIVEYLEDAFPGEGRVLPESAEQRARARQLLSWLRSDETAPIRRERSTATMFYDPTTTPLSAEAKGAAQRLFDVASRVLDGRPQLFDAFSVADADLAFMLHRLILNGDDVPAALRSYAAAQWQRPSVRTFVEKKRPPLVSYG